MEIIKRFLKDEEGAVYVEYALLVGLVALAVVTAVTSLGTGISNLFTNVGNYLSGITVP
ncbi:MAG: Flp family type IVb pilin [Syntrophobacteraceae bacterium]|nr:Flp family type IVb pilin [Syntrophobacteraceae bacterium]